METTSDPIVLIMPSAEEADAAILEQARDILRERFGVLTAGDLISGLTSAAVTVRAKGGIIKPAEPVEPEAPREGWGVIWPGDRKAHYYVQGMSLCRRVGFYQGQLWPDLSPSPDDHKECRRLLVRRKGAAAVVISEEDPS